MTSVTLSAQHEVWPLNAPFRISRGARTEANVVTVNLTTETPNLFGRGESCPYPRYGESIESVLAQIEQVKALVEAGLSNEELQGLLPAGAARNAIDCALWDLRCRESDMDSGKDCWAFFNLPKPESLQTAITIGIDSAEAMGEKAAACKNYPLLKVKLDREEVHSRVIAIRDNAPNARIIIDPNESWDMKFLREVDPFLVDVGITMLEQPLPVSQAEGLKIYQHRVPICADESCHTSSDLEDLVGKYQVINIKLDKTGGLTEALALKAQAKQMGFDIMVGCMISTSLAMAPAILLAHDAAFVDLDGPAWMANDREDGLIIKKGVFEIPDGSLWGS